MLVRLETCWFHMRWAKLDGILHLEMLPICGSFKNVLSSEGETLKDCTLSCSALFSFPCLLFMPLFPSCSAVCRQPGCMLKKASPSVAWKQNFNFCCYKTQLWFPQLGIQYWCNWSEKVPVIWCDMKLFTSSLHIPSNLIKILFFFFYFEKREKYFELCSSLVFPVELSCDKMFIQKMLKQHLFKEFNNIMKWTYFRIDRETVSTFCIRDSKIMSNTLWPLLTQSSQVCLMFCSLGSYESVEIIPSFDFFLATIS